MVVCETKLHCCNFLRHFTAIFFLFVRCICLVYFFCCISLYFAIFAFAGFLLYKNHVTFEIAQIVLLADSHRWWIWFFLLYLFCIYFFFFFGYTLATFICWLFLCFFRILSWLISGFNQNYFFNKNFFKSSLPTPILFIKFFFCLKFLRCQTETHESFTRYDNHDRYSGSMTMISVTDCNIIRDFRDQL